MDVDMDDICAEIEGLVEEAGEQHVSLSLLPSVSAFPASFLATRWYTFTWGQGANGAAQPRQACI